MAKYVTKLFDRIDKICHNYYGTANNGVVEFVIEKNPGLEEYDIVLPAGVTVELPDLPRSHLATPTIRLIQLWD